MFQGSEICVYKNCSVDYFLFQNYLYNLHPIYISDDEKPSITGCPTIELIRNTEPGQNYSLVAWDDITISDNSGNWTVVMSGASQGMLPVGVHQVTYSASDPSGNTEACSFSVRVLGTLHQHY